jgi:hypothetical protein
VVVVHGAQGLVVAVRLLLYAPAPAQEIFERPQRGRVALHLEVTLLPRAVHHLQLERSYFSLSRLGCSSQLCLWGFPDSLPLFLATVVSTAGGVGQQQLQGFEASRLVGFVATVNRRFTGTPAAQRDPSWTTSSVFQPLGRATLGAVFVEKASARNPRSRAPASGRGWRVMSGLRFAALATLQLRDVPAWLAASASFRGPGGELLEELAHDALIGADRDQLGLGDRPTPVEHKKLGQRHNLPRTGHYALYVGGFTRLNFRLRAEGVARPRRGSC